MPAVQDATGNVMVPDFFDIYYVSNTGAGTYYQSLIRSVRPMPAGLKMIAGYDMADPASASNKKFNWYCEVTQNKSQSIPDCPAGEQVGVVLPFPSCWNGRDLDSPNHRDHMAYLVTDDNNRTGCPISHPVLLPEVGFQAWFTHDGDSRNWYLSSDRMPGMTHANGSTFHADWFGAWDPTIQQGWVRDCINGMRNCQDGQLGDGRKIRGAAAYTGPKSIAAPPRP